MAKTSVIEIDAKDYRSHDYFLHENKAAAKHCEDYVIRSQRS